MSEYKLTKKEMIRINELILGGVRSLSSLYRQTTLDRIFDDFESEEEEDDEF